MARAFPRWLQKSKVGTVVINEKGVVDSRNRILIRNNGLETLVRANADGKYADWQDYLETSTQYEVTVAALVSGGSGYALNEIVKIPNGEVLATVKAASVSAGTFKVSAIELEDAGSGYAENDVLTVDAGETGDTEATITVLTVDGSGTILTAEITTAGSYASNVFTNPVSVTGGTGTLATFNLTMIEDELPGQILTATLIDGGRYEVSTMTNPVAVVESASSLGQGATINVTLAAIV